MTADTYPPEARRVEVESLIAAVRRWSRPRPDLRAVALVGSWARKDPRPGSDLDLILLSEDPSRYIEREDWAEELGTDRVTPATARGVLSERRLHLPSGLELDIAIGSPSWARTDPLDPGTVRVASDGLVRLHDPDGLLDRLVAAISGRPDTLRG
jgi:predicted nucleotidyltransferase